LLNLFELWTSCGIEEQQKAGLRAVRLLTYIKKTAEREVPPLKDFWLPDVKLKVAKWGGRYLIEKVEKKIEKFKGSFIFYFQI
jgi:hypothetical protein